MPLPYTPTADLLVQHTLSPTGVQADLVPSASGDALLVAGIARVQQDIALWIATPLGARFSDPTYGNPLWTLLGQPLHAADDYASMVDAAEQAFMANQAVDIANGTLSTDEQVAALTDTQVAILNGNTLSLSFVIHTRAGQHAPTTVALPN